LLLKEPEVEKIILVDNGSTDGTKEYFADLTDDKFVPIYLKKNLGSSVGRNKGLSKTKSKHVFLIDGDILYVRGTIREYAKILDAFPDAGCVGQNSQALLAQLGHNGVYNPTEADFVMDTNYTIEDWFPMAWTQYGLFRGDMLRELRFVELPPYNEAGYGCEDDWLYQEMEKAGYVSLAVDKPVYYHHAHSGWRELHKAGVQDKMIERVKLFEKCWGRNNLWAQRLKRIKSRTTRTIAK